MLLKAEGRRRCRTENRRNRADGRQRHQIKTVGNRNKEKGGKRGPGREGRGQNGGGGFRGNRGPGELPDVSDRTGRSGPGRSFRVGRSCERGPVALR